MAEFAALSARNPGQTGGWLLFLLIRNPFGINVDNCTMPGR